VSVSQQQSFEQTSWIKTPPLPIAVIGLLVGALVFFGLLLVLRTVGADGWILSHEAVALPLGVAFVGAALVATRSKLAAGGAPIVLRDDALVWREQVIPFSTVQRVLHAGTRAAAAVKLGQTTHTTDTTLEITHDGGELRLTALGTSVTQIAMALAVVERANPNAVVTQAIERSMRR
jgi:hypothetical protein